MANYFVFPESVSRKQNRIVHAVYIFYNCLLIQLWNKVMGIPDKLLFVLGSFIYGMAYNFKSITLCTIYAKMSPPGMESTINGN